MNARHLQFQSVDEACFVLRKYTTVEKLKAVEHLGFNLNDYTQAALGKFIGASREKVNRALVSMGRRRINGSTEAATPPVEE